MSQKDTSPPLEENKGLKEQTTNAKSSVDVPQCILISERSKTRGTYVWLHVRGIWRRTGQWLAGAVTGRGVWLTTKRSKEGFDGNVLYLSWGTGDMTVSTCQNS